MENRIAELNSFMNGITDKMKDSVELVTVREIRLSVTGRLFRHRKYSRYIPAAPHDFACRAGESIFRRAA